MKTHLAVFGDPIAHSLSPRIHQDFAQQYGINIEYLKIRCPAGMLATTLSEFIHQGGIGANITVPLKTEAYGLCHSISEIGIAAGAVNTLRLDPSSHDWEGHNTDGNGLIIDLKDHIGFDLNAAKILILGAGGSVNALLPALIEQNPSYLEIQNRTLEKAEALIEPFKGKPNLNLVARPLGHEKTIVDSIEFDLIINATSASLHQATLPLKSIGTHAYSVCYDLMYGHDSAFLGWAKTLKLARYDGLGMLLQQAALAFAYWFKQFPETEVMMRQLRSDFPQC